MLWILVKILIVIIFLMSKTYLRVSLIFQMLKIEKIQVKKLKKLNQKNKFTGILWSVKIWTFWMKENSLSVKGINKQLNSKKLLSKKKKNNCKNNLLSWFLCCKNLTYGQDKWIVILRVKSKSNIIISPTMKLLMPWNHQWKGKLTS